MQGSVSTNFLTKFKSMTKQEKMIVTGQNSGPEPGIYKIGRAHV